ncbi:MAG: hypothetical protein ABII07_02770 [Patescibacteria group bacterium]|nr:hypothetical protein [Patescibacteria group bacterium]
MGDAPKIKESVEAEDLSDVSQETADSSVDASGEAVEFAQNLPAEASENNSENKAVSKGGTQGDDNAAQIAAALKPKELPPRKVMKKQVHTALVKEETRFLRDVKHYDRSGDFFELNNALAKVREIRFILSQLAHDTYEVVKNLWMKYVFNKR